jgi:hypothetical protein
LWMGTHNRDTKKRNYKILLRNLNRTIFFDDDDLNLRVQKRSVSADYNNFWTKQEADTYHFNTSNPKLRGPSVSEVSLMNYETVLEYPIEDRNAEICIPNLEDGDLYNFRIDFTPITNP